MKTKCFFLNLLFALGISSTFAQEAPVKIKIDEFGAGFSNLNGPYSLQYRWGHTKRVMRINILFGAFAGNNSSGNSNNDYNSSEKTNNKTNYNISGGMNLSYIKFAPITEHFGFNFGAILGCIANTYSSESTSSTMYHPDNGKDYVINYESRSKGYQVEPALGFLFGAYVKINARFYLSTEINLGAYLNYNHTDNYSSYSNSNSIMNNREYNTPNDSHTIGLAKLKNTAPLFSLIYRITGKGSQ